MKRKKDSYADRLLELEANAIALGLDNEAEDIGDAYEESMRGEGRIFSRGGLQTDVWSKGQAAFYFLTETRIGKALVSSFGGYEVDSENDSHIGVRFMNRIDCDAFGKAFDRVWREYYTLINPFFLTMGDECTKGSNAHIRRLVDDLGVALLDYQDAWTENTFLAVFTHLKGYQDEKGPG